MCRKNLRAWPAFAGSSVAVAVVVAVAVSLGACSNVGPEGEEDVGTGTSQDSSGSIEGDIAGSEDTGTSTAPDAGDNGDVAGDDTAEDADAIDSGEIDIGENDIGADCPGGTACDCNENSDCDSGICIDTAAGKTCAQTCIDTCPDGFACTKFDPGTGDAIFICTPRQLTLCAPCAVDADCQFYDTTSLCLDYGFEGKFCGSECKADADCPADYACAKVDIGGGNQKQQCKLKDATAVCACTKWAISAGKGTSCSTVNAQGSCSGQRSCGTAGLSACDAPAPASETCDTVDNDCNGTTDDIDPTAFNCVQKAWFDIGSKSACTTDADCTEAGESCADGTKTCRKLIGACPGKATCAKGKIECVEAATPKQEMCNGADDDCDGAVDEDYVWVHPIDKSEVKLGGTCGTGLCSGGTVKCETLSNVVCDSEAANKAAKETCDGKDNDCNGLTDDGLCDDGDLCTKNTCNAANAACESTAAVDCDDSNPCTGDSCDAKTGKCANIFANASCDDGDACTVGDKCTEKDGVAACQAGSAAKCDDGNLCTDDGCDASKGCVALPNAATQACYEGQDPNTEGVGTCKGGSRVCKAGTLLATCEGGVAPNSKEQCDGKDDDCDGKTDETCAASAVEAGFSTVSGTVKGEKKRARLMVGDESLNGAVADQKKRVNAGLLPWLLGHLAK